jgi:hypothetical protein
MGRRICWAWGREGEVGCHGDGGWARYRKRRRIGIWGFVKIREEQRRVFIQPYKRNQNRVLLQIILAFSVMCKVRDA